MTKERVKELREKGYSYTEIAKEVGKSRKFAWKYGHKIKFSKEGKKRYREKIGGVLYQIKLQKPFLTPEKVRVIGHSLFDGMLYNNKYHYLVKYINSSRQLIDQFVKDVDKVYGLKRYYLETIPGKNMITYKVYFKSKLFYEDLKRYFKSYSTTKSFIKIPLEIINSNKEVQIEFIRSFFEDEGSISSNGRIMGDLKNLNIIRQILSMLNKFGLHFKLCSYRDYTGITYKIYLLKTLENLKLFYKLRLFDKSIITNGINMHKKKIEILKEQQ